MGEPNGRVSPWWLDASGAGVVGAGVAVGRGVGVLGGTVLVASAVVAVAVGVVGVAVDSITPGVAVAGMSADEQAVKPLTASHKIGQIALTNG